MFDPLLACDRAVFFFINRDLANGLFDRIFPIITTGKYWIAPAILAAIVYIGRGRRRAVAAVLLALLMIAITDPLFYRIVKPAAGRFRPCDPRSGLTGVRCLIGMRTSGSFPSSHAVNTTALVAFFAFLYPRRRVIAAGAVLALLVGFSRVYVGVHYPGDVLGGAILGILAGLGSAALGRSVVLNRMKERPC